jgi:hypothetical protein
MLSRLVALSILGLKCQGTDPGFDVVRVPQTAYVSSDASAARDGGPLVGDAGRGPIVVCIPELTDPGEDDKVATEFANCLLHHEGRSFDSRATERHRKKDDESQVCCYRRGHVPEVPDEGE